MWGIIYKAERNAKGININGSNETALLQLLLLLTDEGFA